MTIRSIIIEANAARSEVVTTIQHETEASEVVIVDEETGEKTREVVSHSARRFPAFAACPKSTARKLYATALTLGVPVELYGC